MFELLDYNSDKPITEYIAFNGPYIVSIITAISLLYRIPYLFAFIISRFANDQINKILKLTIKEERPKDNKNYGNEKYEGASRYGWPSGHTQEIFFSIIFLYLATKSTPLLIITSFIAAMTFYQRLSSKKHTVSQLLAGSVIGSINGYIAYRITKKFMETKRNPLW